LHLHEFPVICRYSKILIMTAKLYAAAILLSTATLISCSGNKDKEVVDKSVIPAGSETTAAPAINTSNTATTVNPNMVPAAAGTVTSGPALPGANTGTVTMKPQPVSITPQNLVTTAPQTTTITPATTNAVTAPGMNPPHGQPGHRCDIQVGAPLNSKPAAPATVQAAPVTTTAAGQTPSNVTIKEVPNTVKTAPGMNPPHGEPGHRCDIAVGAPLNSKPAAPAPNTPPALVTPVKPDSAKN
jgi:hypothetical protein